MSHVMTFARGLCLIALGCWATTAVSQTVPDADRDFEKLKKQAFALYDPNYKESRDERIRRALVVGRRVNEMEAKGQNVACAHQILTETKWLFSSTADFKQIDKNLDSLEQVLKHPQRNEITTKQDPSDGSWGGCYTRWFFRLDATYDQLSRDEMRERQPELPIRLLDRVNSPDKLRQYFDSVAVSDIAKNGVDNRRELNEAMADLMRLILQDRPRGYRWDPRLKDALMDVILNRLRNAKTGWWGERYIFNGRTEDVDSLSVTFHIIRYLDGKVPDMGKVVETTLAVKDMDEPTGWLSDGHFTDHNNMDVVVLFGFGWQSATAAQRQAMSEDTQRMLDWCLKESLQPDGSFAFGGDDSIEQNTYFGVAFLSRLGYFDRGKRFWTARDFPEAPEIRERIIGFIQKHKANGAAGGTYYENALRELNSTAASARRD
jgi:hypothetical protein